MIPKAEINAVTGVFSDSEYEDLTETEAAEKIIKALDEVREKSKRFVVVANLKWPGHQNFHLYASGPFNTELQAQRLGETFAADPYTKRGNGRWRTVPILAPKGASRTAWDLIRPDLHETPCCSLHHGWIKDDMDRWSWQKAPEGVEHWRKGGW
jgi:hypothetical protein